MKEQFFNLRINATTQTDVFDQCIKIFESTKTHTLYFLNAHCFNVAQKDKLYYNVLEKADILLNDGIGLKIASRFSRIKFKENLNGTDLIPQIIQLAANRKKKIWLLGGKEGVAQRAAQKIKENNPSIIFSGYHSGFFADQEESDLVKRINASNTDILILGMGVPKQEIWADKNKPLLTNVKMIIAGGAILDFISGEINRAPIWMRNIGMEWLYRLFLEPGRMWRRYLIGNIVFFYHVFRFKLKFQ